MDNISNSRKRCAGGPVGPQGPVGPGPVGPQGPAGPAPAGSPGNVVILQSSGVAVSTANLFVNSSNVVGVGSSLQVAGNIYAANSLTTTNVFVNGTLSVPGAMTSNVANTTFFYDTLTIPYINTRVLNVSTLYITSNVTVALANVATLNVASVSNLATLSLMGTTGVTTLNVTGNVFASNALVAPSIYGTTSIVGGTLAGSTQTLSGTAGVTSLNVTGNVFASNAFVAPSIYGTLTGTHYGVVAGSNTLSGSTQTLSGTAGVTSLNVTGNVFASNAFVAPSIYGTLTGTHYGVVAGSNTLSGSTQTLSGTAGVTSLNVTGNVFASNAFVAPSIYGTLTGTHYGVVAGSNTLSGSTQTLGGTAGVTTLNVTGNVFASNAFVAPTINATTALNVSGTFSLGALGGTIRNILCGSTGTQQIIGNGPLLDFFNIGTTLAGTNYLVFMTPYYGSASHVLALQLDSKTTSRVNFQVARVDASSGTTTYTIEWMIIDLN